MTNLEKSMITKILKNKVAMDIAPAREKLVYITENNLLLSLLSKANEKKYSIYESWDGEKIALVYEDARNIEAVAFYNLIKEEVVFSNNVY